jgi:hypothetical protein
LDHAGLSQATIIQSNATKRLTLFEYRFPIEYQEDPSGSIDLLGYGIIYASENTIIERVKYSFILIIINSAIKTIALWFFFLFFAHRVIGRPLKTLANVASTLNPDKLKTLGNSKELEIIINSKHKDEI